MVAVVIAMALHTVMARPAVAAVARAVTIETRRDAGQQHVLVRLRRLGAGVALPTVEQAVGGVVEDGLFKPHLLHAGRSHAQVGQTIRKPGWAGRQPRMTLAAALFAEIQLLFGPIRLRVHGLKQRRLLGVRRPAGQRQRPARYRRLLLERLRGIVPFQDRTYLRRLEPVRY